MKYKILVVDDPLNIKSTMMCLENWGYAVESADSGSKAIQMVKQKREYAVILMDFRMPTKNGAETSAEIQEFNEESVILMYSNDTTRETTLDAFRIGGVEDFVDKNKGAANLRSAVAKACEKYEETLRLLKPSMPENEAEKFLLSIGLVCKSSPMLEIAQNIPIYSQSDMSLLIRGETGVGKEALAHAVHRGLPDKFFALNCASGSENAVFESELYGHEKGSFTGAYEKKIGILERADGGTVFLDELHRLDLNGQAKLLRVLQEKKIRRVGGAVEIPVNFRIVAATQPNIEELVKRGEFLKDLFYRVNYLRIEVPALRDRPEDIAPLVGHFCNVFNKKNKTKKQFLMSTVRALEKYNWPGNVRELDAVVSRALTNVIGSKSRWMIWIRNFSVPSSLKIFHPLWILSGDKTGIFENTSFRPSRYHVRSPTLQNTLICRQPLYEA